MIHIKSTTYHSIMSILFKQSSPQPLTPRASSSNVGGEQMHTMRRASFLAFFISLYTTYIWVSETGLSKARPHSGSLTWHDNLSVQETVKNSFVCLRLRHISDLKFKKCINFITYIYTHNTYSTSILTTISRFYCVSQMSLLIEFAADFFTGLKLFLVDWLSPTVSMH